jgi:hypothetical protein
MRRSNTISGLGMLGMVASGRRSIRSGNEYNKYFDLSGLRGTDPIVMSDGSTYDTLAQMERIAQRDKKQTARISQALKGDSLEKTLKNLWNFLYHNVQYKKDSPDEEQLRSPLRTWKDRKSGVDCDCYSIFISSVLRNLGISHAFRMAAYGSGDYQHVYVVVPKSGNSLESYYTVDPVVDSFNYEVPFTKKHDRFMQIRNLNGLGDCASKAVLRNPSDDLLRVSYIEANGGVVTEKFCTENNIPFSVNENDRHLSFIVYDQIVAPIITPQEAEQLKHYVPVTPCGCNENKKHGNKILLWGIGLASAAAILFSGNSEKKSLGAIPQEAKRKLRALHL